MRSLAELERLVPFLAARFGEPGPDDVASADLIADPDLLARTIASTGEGRGCQDPQVLASLWWQSYAYRTAGTALAAWVVAGAAPDLAAGTGVGVGTSRARPSSLLVGPRSTELDDLPAIVERLFAHHLDPLAESLRDRHQIGARLVWGNVAASVASCLGALVAADGAPAGLGARVDTATAALPHGAAALGSWVVPHRSYRRKTCCLWWKTSASSGAYCGDCSLR